MKFTTEWLKEYFKNKIDNNSIYKNLEKSGFEFIVNGLRIKKSHKIIAGKIKDVSQNSKFKHLKNYVLDIGKKDLEITSSINNISVGNILAVSNNSSKKDVEGREDNDDLGFLIVSEKDLLISESFENALFLPENMSPGKCLRKYFYSDDAQIDVTISPNRNDCLSVRGVAKEISTLSNIPYKEKDYTLKVKNNFKEKKRISCKNRDDCSVYYGRIIKNLNTKAVTPIWMKRRLSRSDIKLSCTINNILNYVLIEIGQPLSVFDNKRISNNIRIEELSESKSVIVENEKNIFLEKGTIVTKTNSDQIMSLSGIIKMKNFSVNEKNYSEIKDIFLESACFRYSKVIEASRKYGISTESSYHHERRINPNLSENGIKFATKLIFQIMGGEVFPINVYSNWKERELTINLNREKINCLLGINLGEESIEQILSKLQISFNKNKKGIWRVIVPPHRMDISIEEDLIEEIGKFYGYENIPFTLPKLELKDKILPERKVDLNDFKSALIGRGYQESINYSFIDKKISKLFLVKSSNQEIMLKNPLSEQFSVMRMGIIPGLMLNFKSNLNRQKSRIRLFESGMCFFKSPSGEYEEIRKIAGLTYGSINPENWNKESNLNNFYNIKSDVESLLRFSNKSYKFHQCVDIAWLNSGKSSYIYCENRKVGVLGVIQEEVMKKLKIKHEPPLVFELNLMEIEKRLKVNFEKKSNFPFIKRDVSFILAKKESSDNLIETIKDLKVKGLESIEISSVYEGINVEKNYKSITCQIIFQLHSETMTDQKVNNHIKKIIDQVQKKLNAEVKDIK